MNLPSRGERESAATTRYTGFFFDPTRVNLSLTANLLPPGLLLLAFALRLSGRGRAGAVRRARCRQSWQGRHLPAAHLLHQLRHLLASLEQLVDLLDLGAAPAGDPLPARAVDQVRQRPLARRHREDDPLDTRELLLVDLVEALELVAEAGNQLHDALERAHSAEHLVALQEVVERELALHHPALELLALVLLDSRLGLLNQAEHVAHAENPRRHPVRVEVLEQVDLLADRDELDRLARDRLDRERRAAARISVELRQHDAVEVDALLEGLRDGDRLLAGHGIENQQDVRRLCLAADRSELVHQRLVDVEAPCRVDDDDVAFGRCDSLTRRLYGIRALGAVDGNLDLAAELLELIDRGRTLQIGGDERGLLALLAQQQRELRGGGRLARPLQAGQQD